MKMENISIIIEQDFKDLMQSVLKPNEWLIKNKGHLAVWEKATDHSDAIYLTALCYAHGVTYEQNYEVAYRLFKKATTYKHTQAMIKLGYLHCYGWGCEKSVQQSIRWYQQAADLEDPQAMCDLACFLAEKEERIDDIALAQQYILKAVDVAQKQKDFVALETIADLYYKGVVVSQNYKEAIKLYEAAAHYGSGLAWGNLGFMFRDGKGVVADDVKALQYFEKAMVLGNNEMIAYYAILVFFGSISNDECAASFIRLLKQGYLSDKLLDELNHNLHRMDISVNDVKEEYVRQLYVIGAERGSADAAFLVGLHYNSVGKNYNPVKAYEWFLKSAEMGSAAGMNAVANCYAYGWGVKKNQLKENKWRQKAKDAGMKY